MSLSLAKLLGLIAVPAVAVAGLALGSGKKKPATSAPPVENQGAAPDAGYTPYVTFTTDAGLAYAADPALKDAIWNALPNWYVTTQDNQGEAVGYMMVPKPAGSPPNMSMRNLIAAAKLRGDSVLLDPRLAFPYNGSRAVAIIGKQHNPWPSTSPDLALYFGAGPWAVAPGRTVGGPASPDPLAALPPALRMGVKKVGDGGPIRAQREMADHLEGDGYNDAAQWLREKAKSRAAERYLAAVKAGGFGYVLRMYELPPYAWTEAYLGAGEGPRRKELYAKNPGLSDSAGWMAGRKIKIPATSANAWPDPEEIDPDSLMGSAPKNSGAAQGGAQGSPPNAGTKQPGGKPGTVQAVYNPGVPGAGGSGGLGGQFPIAPGGDMPNMPGWGPIQTPAQDPPKKTWGGWGAPEGPTIYADGPGPGAYDPRAGILDLDSETLAIINSPDGLFGTEDFSG